MFERLAIKVKTIRPLTSCIILATLLLGCTPKTDIEPTDPQQNFQPTSTLDNSNENNLISRDSIRSPVIAVESPVPLITGARKIESPTDASSSGDIASEKSDRKEIPKQVDLQETPSSEVSNLIDYFEASPAVVDPGDQIILEWHTTNALTVTVWHLMPTGQFGHFWTAGPVGSMAYDVSIHERNRTSFALTAIDERGRTETASTSVTLRCPDQWFFDSPPEICPAEQALHSVGAEQRFQHGYMVWVAGEDHIYVLFEDESIPKWSVFEDKWDEEQHEKDPELIPPDGLLQPIRGFGLIWRQEPAIRERLGWAVGEEVGYSLSVQRTSYAKYNDTFIQARDGSIWHLLPERSGWKNVTG
jgi:hypothetical protein